MYQTIPAVFEQGVFRPLKRIYLKEHQKLLLKLLVPKGDYDSLLETLEILSRWKPAAMQRLKDAATGRGMVG